MSEDLKKLLAGIGESKWSLHDCESFDGRATYRYQEVWDDDFNVICSEVFRAHNDGGHEKMRLIAMAPDLARRVIAAEAAVELLKQVQTQGCEICGGDCASANPPVGHCPMQERARAITAFEETKP